MLLLEPYPTMHTSFNPKFHLLRSFYLVLYFLWAG